MSLLVVGIAPYYYRLDYSLVSSLKQAGSLAVYQVVNCEAKDVRKELSPATSDYGIGYTLWGSLKQEHLHCQYYEVI